MNFANKRILITGGTGSLGSALVDYLLKINPLPEKIIIFSRDEAKQHEMRVRYHKVKNSTDEIIYQNSQNRLKFIIGDIRDYYSIKRAMDGIDIIINAAAMKQVPSCELFPAEAISTNIYGPLNIVRAVQEGVSIKMVVGISTDKACLPINTMGMTKALQEKIFISANLACHETNFSCVRYGNVISSRGSVIPLFLEQIKNNLPITITDKRMTRFLMPISDAIKTIEKLVQLDLPATIVIPQIPSVNMLEFARAMIAYSNCNIPIEEIGIRPGEKIHESLMSLEESQRARLDEDFYIVGCPIFSEMNFSGPFVNKAYTSDKHILSYEKIVDMIKNYEIIKTGNL